MRVLPGGWDLSIVLPFIIFTTIWGSTWIVIHDQLGVVPAPWSVAYRFVIAAAAMAAFAHWKGQSLRPDRGLLAAAAALGLLQFCFNFNFVYLAERHITSGLVATVFALLLIPNTLLGALFLDQRPTRRFLVGSLVATAGIALLFIHEIQENPARTGAILAGIGFTLLGLLAASAANILQARREVRRFPLFSLLAWSMLAGAIIDSAAAFLLAGPPVFESRPGYWIGLVYLALFASALSFSLYFPVVRKIGPAKAAYSSLLVPVIAMALSTLFEDYRWSAMAAGGAVLALGGMAIALRRSRTVVASPDAA